MSLTERAAYLRGLADGLKLGEDPTEEGKVLLAVLDVLGDIAANVEANNESISALADELDELDDVVSGMEEVLLGEDAFEDDADEEADDEEIVEYELECPECGKPVVLDEETIEDGEVVCPHCQQKLTIDIGFEDEEEE
ncbi:MAG: zinc ribbon domain-containing protein [Oscillospiraceae bacterium]|nr:zinc ribbon domain-containing protein [Oscillospiraceae bacterium]